MASKAVHFIPAKILPEAPPQPTEFPVELMAGLGGVLLLFVITFLLILRRMNRPEQIPD